MNGKKEKETFSAKYDVIKTICLDFQKKITMKENF